MRQASLGQQRLKQDIGLQLQQDPAQNMHAHLGPQSSHAVGLAAATMAVPGEGM